MPAVELRHIYKSFAGTYVLQDVSLAVQPGQIHAVVGHNGAGKSTLMKILQGVHQADAGEILLGGHVLRRPTPSLVRSLGVGMVYQERSLVPTLSGLDNLFLNNEVRGITRRIRRGVEYRQAAEICARLGVSPALLGRRVGEMSAVEQEMLEVAKALRVARRLIILDEPTGPLGGSEVQDLFKVIRATAATGVGVVLITHHLGEVFDIADFVTCLREGRVTLSCPTQQTNIDELITAIVGESSALAQQYASQARQSAATGTGPGEGREVALEVRSLLVPGKLHDVSFEVLPGEIVGLVGLAGSGRSTLLKVLYGDIRPAAGEVRLFGRPVRPGHPADAIRRGIYLIPEDRAVHGLVLSSAIVENVALSVLDRLRSWGVLRMSRARRRTRSAMQQLGIRAKGPDQVVSELSGGNQQKVVIAKAVQTDARLLLLDEPTFGVDIGASRDVARYVHEFVAAGNAALWVSSDLHELLTVADRILVLSDGTIQESIGRGTPEFDESTILAKMQRRSQLAAAHAQALPAGG
ncbi:MAG TPA: sugar ABC transporter ATP-binding protein [Acidimicrobiales bacterium]|nr:sugar ABC transporter ATP-binding protein [Acidimicrobiales bacterium]